MKTCSKCNLELSEKFFGKNTAYRDGLQSRCKSCIKISANTRKEKKAAYDKAYGKTHKEQIAARGKTYRKANKEKRAIQNKAYNAAHKDEVTAYGKEYTRNRRQTDSRFRIAANLRTRLWTAITSQESPKMGSAVDSLGCTIEELKKHLEASFYPNPETGEAMSWENYGDWHIDHIRPLNSFDLSDSEQLKSACNYTNLQPLWAKDNLKKNDKWNEE